MRVLAVDPGLTRCGVGVVDGVPGRKLSLVDVGVIRTPSGDPTPRRLVAVEDEMRQWFAGTVPRPSPSSASSPTPTCPPSWAPPR